MGRVFYLVPDFDAPSWGVGLLYEHVALLREAGVDARVLHERRPFRVSWRPVEVPVEHLDALAAPPVDGDLVVVPEVLAREAAGHPWPCARVVYVQGTFLMLRGGAALRYPDHGYAGAMAVLPHVAAVVERHFGVRPALVPPFVAEHFFTAEGTAGPRERRVLLVVKDDYRRVGFPDYEIVTALLRRRFAERGGGWELRELAGLDHRGVAAEMARAAVLVNLNTHETFNATVPEAMACGCLAVTYEAVGGQDVLTDGQDAFVLPNHHAYDLVDRLFGVLDGFEAGDPALDAMRERARASAGRFRRAATGEALLAALRPWL